jgi:hypothetical protein
VRFTAYTHAGAHVAVWLVNNRGHRQRALAMLASYDVQQPADSAGQVRDVAAPPDERLRGRFEASTVAGPARRPRVPLPPEGAGPARPLRAVGRGEDVPDVLGNECLQY